MAWRITERSWHSKEMLKALLAAGWEPFAVTEVEDDATVWLRRLAAPAEAGVNEVPQRLRGEPEVTR